MITITTFQTPFLKSNMYLLSKNGHGIIIDPYSGSDFCTRVKEQAPEIDLVLLTHEHYDHISGTNAFRAQFHSRVLCGESCGRRIQNASDNFSHYFNAYVSLQEKETVPEDLLPTEDFITFADETFSGELTLFWQGHRLELRETPGHSPGSICILVDGEILFSGDSLLPDGKAILRFPGGSRRQYTEKTLPYLWTLPLEANVYPGHYDPFLLGDHPAMKNNTIERGEHV